MSLAEIDKLIDDILSEAENKKLMILKNAQKKAELIKQKPFPVEEYRQEAGKILQEAEESTKQIIAETERKILELRNIPEEKKREVIELIKKYVMWLK
ncbi:MAG: hypothetical protein QXP68_02885 [Thermosphaera sp.]